MEVKKWYLKKNCEENIFKLFRLKNAEEFFPSLGTMIFGKYLNYFFMSRSGLDPYNASMISLPVSLTVPS